MVWTNIPGFFCIWKFNFVLFIFLKCSIYNYGLVTYKFFFFLQNAIYCEIWRFQFFLLPIRIHHNSYDCFPKNLWLTEKKFIHYSTISFPLKRWTCFFLQNKYWNIGLSALLFNLYFKLICMKYFCICCLHNSLYFFIIVFVVVVGQVEFHFYLEFQIKSTRNVIIIQNSNIYWQAWQVFLSLFVCSQRKKNL